MFGFLGSSSAPATELNRDAIVVNSDSNSSLPADPQLDQQMPKKRGRKKGSKNYKNLIDEAETSFTNKMAVSRGNAKVKTTQELIASLQNKSNTLPPLKPIEDLNERAAKLTERVSIIDQKLNTNANRYVVNFFFVFFGRGNLKLGNIFGNWLHHVSNRMKFMRNVLLIKKRFTINMEKSKYNIYTKKNHLHIKTHIHFFIIKINDKLVHFFILYQFYYIFNKGNSVFFIFVMTGMV